MRAHVPARILAASLMLGAASFAFPAVSEAAVSVSVSFNTFHDQLSPYGDWVYSDRWGEVWVPDVSADFHPYDTSGHWVYTDDYGWMWVSDYEWGDIAFHYGRWVNDPDDGWMWIPGYVWSPGWVVWRSSGTYMGWMPMPPDDDFLRGGASFGVSTGGLSFSINFNDTNGYYGYSRWYGRDYDEDRFATNWTFVRTGHMGDRDYRRYRAPRTSYRVILRSTRNITNYTIVNNYVVNRSVNVRDVERASGRKIQAQHSRDVIKRPQFVTHVDTGRDVQTRMRTQTPRGTGEVGSAPRPTQDVIQSLSTKVPKRNGKHPAHVFTRDTITQAPLSNAPAANAPVEPVKPAKPGTSPTGPAAPTGTPPTALPSTPNTPSTTTAPATPETPRKLRDRTRTHAPDITATPPESGNITPEHPATTTGPGKHLETTPPIIEKPPVVHDKNTPTLPGSETPKPGRSGNETPSRDQHMETMPRSGLPPKVDDRAPAAIRGQETTLPATKSEPAAPVTDKVEKPLEKNGKHEKKPKPDENSPPPQ